MKIVKYVTLLCFFLSNFALADDFSILPEGLEEVPKGRSTSLEKGDKAPFDGLLLDDAAIAKILADKYYEEEKHKLEIEEKDERHILELKYVKEQNEIELKALEEKRLITEEAKEKEINFLREIVKSKEEEQDNYVWWLVGGLAGGILITTGIAAVIVVSL